jgi:hypothetical protein
MQPADNDIPISKDDCVDLFRKYNCSPDATNQLCSNLNACISLPSKHKCLITTRTDNKEETDMETLGEWLENWALACGGTFLGTFFSNLIHFGRIIIASIFALLTTQLGRLKGKK